VNLTEIDNHPLTTLRKRGPKSAASIASLKVVPDSRMRPPEPPTDLTPAERQIWDGIVEKLRPGWLYSSEALLASYCRLVAQEGDLAREIAQAEPGSRRRSEVLKLMISVAKASANIATKLRLSPRSRRSLRSESRAVRAEALGTTTARLSF
jgi:hypothetical protein